MQLEEIDVRMSVGDFVLKRLAELGARYLFGVPGDYNLWFSEQAGRSNQVEFVGCCNELDAAYARTGLHMHIIAVTLGSSWILVLIGSFVWRRWAQNKMVDPCWII
jgi:hypothetical protein